MSAASATIEQHVRQLIHDETARAVAQALTPVVTEAAKAAAAETYRRMAESEAHATDLIFSPIDSYGAAKSTIEASVRRSREAREQFAFHMLNVRQACLEMAVRQGVGIDHVAEAAKYEQFILWGSPPLDGFSE